MLPITQEWVDKAEGDWGSLEREGQVQTAPNYDLICYLAQQCAEKYLKARLQEESLVILKTHDLEKLLDLLLPTHPFWNAMRPALHQLTDYAVAFRYPGDSADKKEARNAMALRRGVPETVQLSLGLPL